MAIPAIGAILSGVGRAAVGAGARGVAGAGIRGGIRSGIAQGVKNIGRGIIGDTARNIFSGRSSASSTKTDENGNETIVPVNVRVVEGYATATKGSGGGGGGLVPFGGGSSLVSRKSSAIVKAGGGNSLIEQLRSLRARLDQLVEIELAAKKSLEDQILRYIRDSEKNARSEEQKQQETGSKAKSGVEKNPVVKAAKKAFGGIFDFIKNLVIEFIKYKVLDWLSKPENFEKIKNTIQFFMNFFKVLKTLYDVILGPQLKLMGMMTSLVAGGINTFFEFIGGVVNFFSLKWLPGFDGIIETIKNIPKIFTEMIPNAINGIINFFTKTLFGAAENEGEKAVSSAVGETQQKTNPVVSATAETGQSAVESVDKIDVSGIGNAIGGVVQSITNPVASITKFVDGMFGGGKKEETPQLKEGGLVGKFKNSVSVKPLDELANVAGISGTMKKSIKMFMDLLTMPFKLMGAAMIALVMNTVGKIPGVKMFLKPIVQNIISAFNLPPSIAKIVDNSGTLKKEKKKEPPKKVEPKKQPTSNPVVTQKIPEQLKQSDPTNTETGSKVTQTADNKAGIGRMSQIAGTKEGIGHTDQGDGDTRWSEFDFDGKKYKIKIFRDSGRYELYEASKVLGFIPWDKPINIGGPKGPEKGGTNEKLLQMTHARVKDWYAIHGADKGKILKYLTDEDIKRSKERKQKEVEQQNKSKGGWINGPQSGYPVSLDGGLSTSFIGHGTEWVGFKKAAGGDISSAFVIPYDTPATRSNGGLTQRRFNEAKTGGYHLPYAQGGKVKPQTSTSGEKTTNKGSDKKSGSGGAPAVVSAGKLLLQKGFTVAENPFFKKNNWQGKGPNTGTGYVSSGNSTVGGHSSGSLHYKGLALDITDWRPGDWQGRTKQLAEEMYKNRNALKLTQIIHDPWGSWFAGGGKGGAIGGHPTHLHLGFASGPGSENVELSSSSSSDGALTSSPSSPDSTSTDTETSQPQFGEGTIGQIQELYRLLNPGSEPASSQLPKLQTENLVNTAFSTPSLIGKSTTAIIDASSQSSINTSVMSGDNPLGNTLPMTGNWSIFKINL